MKLAEFIAENHEGILQEWDDFAKKYLYAEMLTTIVADMNRKETASDQAQKTKGQQPSTKCALPASSHGAERLSAGFSLKSTVAEYRALRASVIRLWMKKNAMELDAETEMSDLIHFNEAIDQAITASVVSYSQEKEQDTRMFEAILAVSPDLIFSIDLEGRFIYANKPFADLFGLTRDQMCGKENYDLVAPIAAEFRTQIGNVIRTKQAYSEEVPFTANTGNRKWYAYVFSPVFANDGLVETIICIAHDVTARRTTEHNNWVVANYDGLTGLPNRNLFTNRLEEYVKQSHRLGSSIALLFIDLDYFKAINDRFGYEAGDSVLKQAAERINSCIRESDTAARLGGDEFTVILLDLLSPTQVQVVAEKIRVRLSEPFALGDGATQISASIGVSLSPEDASFASELVNHADIAMYASKSKGRNQFNFFSPEQKH